MTPSVDAEIDRYLRTGATDPHSRAWPSESFMARHMRAREDLRRALVAEVTRRSQGAVIHQIPPPEEVEALARRKTEPMVRGLFPRAEQEAVLALVERSIVFLTPDTIAEVLREESFDHAAWDLANLYLESAGAELLGSEAPRLLGISQDTTCYVSPRYFEEDDPFADFIVHEVAHIFHNCKRHTAGLRSSRRREWMLEIKYQKRETFAYACEAFSRIVERGLRPAARASMARAFGKRFRCGDTCVDNAEVADIVLEAAGRRNGWKVILARCAPRTRT
ncbi:MAG: hypothetical protein ABIO70_04730 [Pseudomonadota bacterium]